MWCRSSPPTISKTVLYYASFAVDLHNDPTRCSVMDIVLVVNSRTDHQMHALHIAALYNRIRLE